MGVTAIKRIHNLTPGGTRVVVRKANETGPSGTVEFMSRGDRDVDWWIPWAWEEWHFTGGAHIDVEIAGRSGMYSLWQQDDLVVYTGNGTFTGPRVRLGRVDGDRRLVIFSDHLELIGMTEPLPAAGSSCQTLSAPYDIVPPTGLPDVRQRTDGGFAINNSGWIARSHTARAGFEKRAVIPNTGRPIQIEAHWDIVSHLRAEGVGLAFAQIVLLVTAHPQTMSSGALGRPFLQERLYRELVLPYFGFGLQPAGSYPGNPYLSLTISSNFTTDDYVLRAFVTSKVGGFGFVQVEASCFGRFLGFNVCRL